LNTRRDPLAEADFSFFAPPPRDTGGSGQDSFGSLILEVYQNTQGISC